MWYNNSDIDNIVITSYKKFPWSKPFYSRSFTHFVRFRLFTFCVEYYRILWPKFTLYITEHFSFVDLVVFFPFRIWHKKYAKKHWEVSPVSFLSNVTFKESNYFSLQHGIVGKPFGATQKVRKPHVTFCHLLHQKSSPFLVKV